MGADRGNQMCWDQTGYCRGNGWQTSGGVPPAEVLREGHLLSVCVSMQCISFVLCHVCVLTFVYLSLLVSFTVSPSSLPVCVCVSVQWVLDI